MCSSELAPQLPEDRMGGDALISRGGASEPASTKTGSLRCRRSPASPGATRCPVDDRSRAELLAEHPVVLAQEGTSSCSIRSAFGWIGLQDRFRHLCSCSGL